MTEEKNENKTEMEETDKKQKSEIKEDKKSEEKKKKEVPKKTEAVVNVNSLSMSTKTAGAICRFIKGKEIRVAIDDLKQVIAKRKAVPMRGEIPHRKGNIMAGRYPKNASEIFIKLLKSLNSNAVYLGVENPVVSVAIPNSGSRPYGKFGAVRKKKTHMVLKATSKKNKMEKKK